MNRRNFLSKISILGLSVLGAGCVPTGVSPISLIRKDDDTSNSIEDFYKSNLFSNSHATSTYSYYNPEESNKAQNIFNYMRTNRKIPQSLNIPTEEQVDKAIALFDKVKTKYAGKKVLETDETYEVMQHLIPMMRMYVDIYSIDMHATNKKSNASVYISDNGTITIPPGFVITTEEKGFCLDAGAPAPGNGEKLTMMPVSELIPQELVPLYKAMQQKAYNDNMYKLDMQKLMWTLVAAGKEYGMASNVDRRTLQQMEQAMPGGASIFQNYHQKELTKNKLKNEFSKLINLNIGGRQINPLDFNDPNKRQQVFNDLLHSSLNTPVTGEMPRDNRDYQMIAPDIAAYSIGSNTLTPRITIVNAGTKPYNINMSDWVMKPARKAQPIAMLPSSPSNVKADDFPIVPDPQKQSLYEKVKSKLDKSMIGEAARFLNEKVLKNVSKNPIFRDYAFRYLVNNPGARKLIEAMPYIGNAISFYEAVSGKNWVTGRDLNAFERVAAGLVSIPGGNFLKSAFKEKLVNVAQMAFAGAGFATNVGIMQKDVAAYAKTFTNPLDLPSNLIDKRVQDGLVQSLSKMSESPNLSKAEKDIIMRGIRESM